jgi:uncharacterized protein
VTVAEAEGWGRRCAAFVRERMDGDAAHDLGHVRRVVAAARRLAVVEGADLRVVLPAAWLHDCVVVPKDSPDRARASRLAAAEAARWLRAEGFPEPFVPAVAHAVEAHSFSAGIEPQTPEARVVQDADRLDALGAVGVARLFATAGATGAALFHPDDPFAETGRLLDDRRWALDHVSVKLLRLPESMQTTAGRAEAERRAAVVRAFVRDLRGELVFGPDAEP